jgi:steroid 5-alpha reductase family enzyme
VDIWWGLSFPLQAWSLASRLPELAPRANLMLILVTLWGGRLGLYLLVRKAKEGWVEDHRYMEVLHRARTHLNFSSGGGNQRVSKVLEVLHVDWLHGELPLRALAAGPADLQTWPRSHLGR